MTISEFIIALGQHQRGEEVELPIEELLRCTDNTIWRNLDIGGALNAKAMKFMLVQALLR